MQTKKNIFEVSWEVCNKVGGIYSVISSKASIMNNMFNYIGIGPYIRKKAEVEFSEEEPPKYLDDAIKEIEKKNIKVHYGTWLIKGEPKALLFESKNAEFDKDHIKKQLWESFGIDSLMTGIEFEEPLIFSWCVGEFLRILECTLKIDYENTILHAHEWMTGFAILKLKLDDSKIKTVFTTHATMLGRSISSNTKDLYETLGNFDVWQRAKQIGVIDKHTAEKASANTANVFTTVSEITAREASIILGRKPEVILMNGLDMDNFPSIEDTSIEHMNSRESLREFLAYTFFPYYRFNLEHNLSFYLAGRYEFENKGIDIFIDALGKLNEYLKKQDSERTISVFFFMAMPNLGVKEELLENKNHYKHIKNYVELNSKEFMRKIVNDFLSKENVSKDVFSAEFKDEMRKDVLRFRRDGYPVLCTHKLHEHEENNSIIKAFRANNLNNSEWDKVKVLLYPAYLDGNDSLLNLEFYETVAGCHLGVFPSYYEPWGYTPLESAAMGVPAITTDLAGFGRFIQEKPRDENDKGIFVLERDKKKREEYVEELYLLLKKFAEMSRKERVKNKVNAKDLSELADWKILIKNYEEAYDLCNN
ncbi:glycogen/starch synthase [Candidatus Woesearchaeota archaeon]|nr:glycogen/starch synthase [Candidatus Woesearchaeota archaeon]MCF7901129.1 glycogen/starch synthase [Candidatus Woesearchaeota archaeon]MCF8012882.1 glycogen/starch synthase [Candidatus Woesearchaeota archaeon]